MQTDSLTCLRGGQGYGTQVNVKACGPHLGKLTYEHIEVHFSPFIYLYRF